MKKERFVDWWKQDKRYMTLLKAVLMAPVSYTHLTLPTILLV